jgi:zinc protease
VSTEVDVNLRSRSAVILSAILLAVASAAGAAPETPEKKPPAAPGAVPKLEFEKYTLPNGLQVILHVDKKLPMVHVNQWYHVGSKNERPGRTGFAHLFEHMMFQGSGNAKEDYFTYVEKLGANLQEGGVNGTTNQDRTNYFATVPSSNLETLLWVESDRLATLPQAMTKEKLDNQRDVVKNERRQGLENTPYGRWYKLVLENLHPAGHPYSWTVIGSHEDLTAASLEDVTDFFKEYYTPNNLSLVIAGDFDPAEAKRLVEKYFGGIPAGPPLDRPKLYIPVLEGEKVVEANDRVPQDRVYMAWPSPAQFTPGDADLDLASLILADGLSSRLKKTLVYDRQVCTDVQAFQASSEISSWFAVVGTARPGVSLEQVEKVVTEEIARLAKTGPTAAELSRAKTKFEFTFVGGLESIGGFGGKADRLNQYNTMLGDPGKLDWDMARYRSATVESVRAAVAKWLDTRNRLLVRFRVEPSGRASEAALDRSKEPAPGADRPFTAPAVETTKLSNGLDLFVVPRPELPKVGVTFVTRAGAEADPAGKAGVAHMTVTQIDMGTPTRRALEIEDSLGDLGVTLTGAAVRESARVSFEALKRNLDPAMAIVADVIRNPSFPATEFEREKKRHLDTLSQQDKNANVVGGRVRSVLAFGPDHPYGRPAQGFVSTVTGVTREDLAAFHRDRWKPGSSALIVSGDVTLAEAKALAEKYFGSWPAGSAPPVAVPAPSPAAAGKIYVVDRQDAAQTFVSQFLPAPKRKTPDYYTLSLADTVFGGGGFGTRLNLNLREDKGYSYGVFSTLALFDDAGVWYSAGGVQTNKTKESVVEFDKELKGMTARPLTEAEFTDTKSRKVRGYAQQFETLERIDEQIADLWVSELPMSELQREYDETQKATLADTNAAAQKWARPEKASFVLVGDWSKIGPGLKELKLGEVVLVDTEGRPVKQ